MYAAILKKQDEPPSTPTSSSSGTKDAAPSAQLRLKRLSNRRRLHEWLVWVCSVSNTTAAIAVPWVVISKTQASLGICVGVCGLQS